MPPFKSRTKEKHPQAHFTASRHDEHTMVVNMIKVTLSGCKIHFSHLAHGAFASRCSSWVVVSSQGCPQIVLLPRRESDPGDLGLVRPRPQHWERPTVCVFPWPRGCSLGPLWSGLEDMAGGMSGATWGPLGPDLHPDSAQQLAQCPIHHCPPHAPHPRSCLQGRVSAPDSQRGCCLWTP